MSPLPFPRGRNLFRRVNFWPALGLALIALGLVGACATVGAVLSALSNQ